MAMPEFIKKKIAGSDSSSSEDSSSSQDSSSTAADPKAKSKTKSAGSDNPLAKWAAKRGV